MDELLQWDVYEIQSEKKITFMMFRGRIRKFGLENEMNILTENAHDKENTVRFAILESEDVGKISSFIQNIFPSKIVKVLDSVPNPVLSKLKVNKEERYTI